MYTTPVQKDYRWPECVGMFITALSMQGGATLVAATVWAWAVQVEIYYGLIAGAIAGSLLALNNTLYSISAAASYLLAAATLTRATTLFVPPLFLLTAIGAVVGAFTHLV